MEAVEITSSSTKGQVVIPSSIRKRLGIRPGCKLVIMTDGDNILLKPIKPPRKDSFVKLIRECQTFAEKAGLTEEDLKQAIKDVRSEKSRS